MDISSDLNSKVGENINKVLLLYSGGLDTSCLLKWIQENYGAQVYTLTLDIGQRETHLKETKEKALKLGAAKAIVQDIKKEFANEYISTCIKANGLYQGQYPLSTAIARPLKSKVAVEIANRDGVDAIAHGSTGKGNDQVRFEVSIAALDGSIKVLAPVREWEMSRDQEIAYAKDNHIPIPVDINSPYSIDENLWGRSIECGVLEYPDQEPPDDIYQIATPICDTPNEPEYVKIGFDQGIPTSLNHQSLDLVELVQILNQTAGKHGVGMIDMVEDRVVGLKSREVYECPAAVALIQAHKDLEKFCCTIHQNSFKPLVDQRWAEMAYQGLMFDPLTSDLKAYIDQVNQKVSGEVTVKLFKGKATVVGRCSANGLYQHQLATYAEGDIFDQSSSPGFIDIWGLPTRVACSLKQAKVPTGAATNESVED